MSDSDSSEGEMEGSFFKGIDEQEQPWKLRRRQPLTCPCAQLRQTDSTTVRKCHRHRLMSVKWLMVKTKFPSQKKLKEWSIDLLYKGATEAISQFRRLRKNLMETDSLRDWSPTIPRRSGRPRPRAPLRA